MKIRPTESSITIRLAISSRRSNNGAGTRNRKETLVKAGILWILGPTLLAVVAATYAREDLTKEDFLGAVEHVVKAIEAEDYETFESYFSENTRGLQPDQLWRRAFGLLRKFGRIKTLEFREMDEGSGGAFVIVTFENAKRDVFVRLSKKTGKIRELTYVPPTNVH